MKSILLAVFFAAAPAMALSPGDGGGNDQQLETQYLSWCSENNVIGQDAQGQLYVRATCETAKGQKCKTTETYRPKGSIVTAACVPK